MTKEQNIASFVLRFTQDLWEDNEKETHVRWRGHIRHVQGNEENRFTDFAEATIFIQRHLTQLTIDNLSRNENMTQERILQESFKIWEQFASSYTNMMFQAMEQSVRQSKAFKEHIDETRSKILNAWQLPFQTNQEQPDQEKLVKKVNKLQAQLHELTDRVTELERKLEQKQSS